MHLKKCYCYSSPRQRQSLSILLFQSSPATEPQHSRHAVCYPYVIFHHFPSSFPTFGSSAAQGQNQNRNRNRVVSSMFLVGAPINAMCSCHALWLTLALFLSAAASESCDGDVSQMLQKSAVAKGAITHLPLDEFEHTQLAQKLLDLKGACRNATEDCLPLLRVVRSTVWPRVNSLTGLENEPEVNAFRADVALARLRGRCQNFPHAMGFIKVWKSGTDESIEKLKNISSSYHPMRNNATFCQMLDEVNPMQRSIVTFVEEPLRRFISGYAQMEVGMGQYL